jgi:hypothetical protein
MPPAYMFLGVFFAVLLLLIGSDVAFAPRYDIDRWKRPTRLVGNIVFSALVVAILYFAIPIITQ